VVVVAVAVVVVVVVVVVVLVVNTIALETPLTHVTESTWRHQGVQQMLPVRPVETIGNIIRI
jgi:hypothetical protein